VKEDALYTVMEIGFAVNEVEFILNVVKERTRKVYMGEISIENNKARLFRATLSGEQGKPNGDEIPVMTLYL